MIFADWLSSAYVERYWDEEKKICRSNPYFAFLPFREAYFLKLFLEKVVGPLLEEKGEVVSDWISSLKEMTEEKFPAFAKERMFPLGEGNLYRKLETPASFIYPYFTQVALPLLSLSLDQKSLIGVYHHLLVEGKKASLDLSFLANFHCFPFYESYKDYAGYFLSEEYASFHSPLLISQRGVWNLVNALTSSSGSSSQENHFFLSPDSSLNELLLETLLTDLRRK